MRTATSPPNAASALRNSVERTARRSCAARARAACGLEQRFEPGLVLVHLGELAVAAIALDELALALDLLCAACPSSLRARASRSSRCAA